MAIRMRFLEASHAPVSGSRRDRRAGVVALLAVAATFAVASGAKADPSGKDSSESNQCVACHDVEHLPITLGHSMSEWRASEHARSGVTCEDCHGGDAAAKDATAAHVGVLPSSDKASKVSPLNLAATCGSCHEKQYTAYKTTVHAKKANEENETANCVTCHGSMATSYPSIQEMNSRCSDCHERRVEARAALSWLASAKKELMRARRSVDEAKAVAPEWSNDATTRFHAMEKDLEAIELKWHQFNMKDSIHESRDLLNLAKLLSEEAHLKMKIEKEKKAQ
jgi:cytochrome c553